MEKQHGIGMKSIDYKKNFVFIKVEEKILI